MSNILYEGNMYNEDRKSEFLSEKAKGTQKIFKRIFNVSFPLEEQLNKDLTDFNRVELTKLFYLYRPASKASSSGNVGYVHAYIDWCIENGYKRGLNPLDLIDPQWKQQFANTEIKRFWTDKEINKIIQSRENAQDAIIISLLFEGARGSGGSELLNLHKNSLDEYNHQLHLEDDNGTRRTITVSDQCMKICKQALVETEYSKMNGNASPEIKAPMAQLIEGNFILRNANTRTTHINETEKSIIHRRLAKIETELQMNGFTPIALSRSGMLKLAKDKILDHGELTSEDIVEIAIQFGENSDSAVYRLKSDFLNEESIRSLYKLP